MKSKLLLVALCSVVVLVLGGSTQAGEAEKFSTDKFDNFTLHTYASMDPMADVSFIVEGEKSLVIIEPQAFKGNVEEFVAYTAKLGKPIERVLVSFHAGGLSVYKDEYKVIPKPMAGFMQSDAAKGMMAYFDKAFEGAMDTEVVEFDKQLDATAGFTVDGVEYELEPTSLSGMPGVNIAIGDKVYYQHFAPAKGFHASKNQIHTTVDIDGALADAEKARKAGYVLFLGSHGYGRAGVADLEFQIKYLEDMKQVADSAESAEEFTQQMLAKYPEAKGDEDLNAIASSLYK